MENYRILIVDDTIETIQTISCLLEESHPEYRLYQATCGFEALKLTESISFDLIISDWIMPEISGLDLVKILKSTIKTCHIPVIIATAVKLTSNDLETALSAGAYDYIRIPIDPVELTARVNSALALVSCHLKEIEQKNLELVEKTLFLVKNNEFNIDLQKKLNKLLDIFENNSEVNALIHNIINEIEIKIKRDSWERFKIAFNNVNTEFNKNLINQFPHLTPSEIKLCIFIKLGMNIKDTSSLLYLSPNSLKVARSRLRKKLQLNTETSLQNFLAVY
jgi:DNA-binding response OmpR family regulator